MGSKALGVMGLTSWGWQGDKKTKKVIQVEVSALKGTAGPFAAAHPQSSVQAGLPSPPCMWMQLKPAAQAGLGGWAVSWCGAGGCPAGPSSHKAHELAHW